MRVDELCRLHLVELKQAYLTQLDESGELKEVTGLDTLGWEELGNANEIISDELIIEHHAGVEFTIDNFTTQDVDDLFPDLNIELKEVECDEMGDPYWTLYAIFRNGDKEIWSDYFHDKPDDETLYNTLQEAWDGGCIDYERLPK